VSFTPRLLYFQGKILHYPPCRGLFGHTPTYCFCLP